MTKNSEYQAKFRKENTQVWVGNEAKTSAEKLANWYGVSQRYILSEALNMLERIVTDGLYDEDNGASLAAYERMDKVPQHDKEGRLMPHLTMTSTGKIRRSNINPRKHEAEIQARIKARLGG